MKTRHTATARAGARRAIHAQRRDIREEIIDWLRDAYAMERAMEQALDKQANNEDLSLEVRDRAAAHLVQTRRHAEAVRSALQSLNADVSVLKTTFGVIAQATKDTGSAFARDERIKDLLDAYSMEHFEIACYTALAVAAAQAGLTQVVEMCRRIIPDEERMAQLLKHSLPAEVSSYLFEEESGASSEPERVSRIGD